MSSSPARAHASPPADGRTRLAALVLGCLLLLPGVALPLGGNGPPLAHGSGRDSGVLGLLVLVAGLVLLVPRAEWQPPRQRACEPTLASLDAVGRR